MCNTLSIPIVFLAKSQISFKNIETCGILFYCNESIVFLKVLDLLHNFSEHLRAVLRWIAILDEAYFDIKFELIADNLIIEPIGE